MSLIYFSVENENKIIMAEMLEFEFIFRMTANNSLITELGGNACLDIGFDLKTDHVQDEDNVEAAPKELIDLIDRHEKRFQSNIESPLEVNLWTVSKKNVVLVSSKLDRDLRNWLVTLLNEFNNVFAWSNEDMPSLNTDIVFHHLPLGPECKPVRQKIERHETRVEHEN